MEWSSIERVFTWQTGVVLVGFFLVLKPLSRWFLKKIEKYNRPEGQ